MKRLLLMVSLFMMSQTVFSDIIETRVTLPDDLGTGIMSIGGWRSIFVAFMVFSVISILWLNSRLVEPLAPEARRPFRLAAFRTAFSEMMALPMVRNSIYVQTLIFGVLFTSISLIQPTFDLIFDKSDQFALYFFGIGIFCAT